MIADRLFSREMLVSDRGEGIDPAVLPGIFDPFLAARCGGSGPEQAPAHSIVTRHGGSIDVAPGSAQGTTMRVLVMDDEGVVRLMCTRLLERLGYRATAVEDGSAALGAFAQAGTDADPFDLVIVDLTVPGGMGGRETGAKLLQLDPHARIVISSGYHDDEVMARYRDFGFTGVIRKPYSLSELSRVVSSALHQA